MPLPKSLAPLKWEISEKKWEEARRWSASRIAGRKYRLPGKQRPDGTVASSGKSIASRFYQLRTRHALTGQYLQWMKNRPNASVDSVITRTKNPRAPLRTKPRIVHNNASDILPLRYCDRMHRYREAVSSCHTSFKVVKKTTCGMKDITVQMTTMGEQIDKPTEENRALWT
jgi:hypothetical protein